MGFFGIIIERRTLTLAHLVLRAEAWQVKSAARDAGFGIEGMFFYVGTHGAVVVLVGSCARVSV